MTTYRVMLKLLSPTLIGSGEGAGALIDTDIVFDKVGLPFVPAKRVKGCLRDSIEQLWKIMQIQAHMPCAERLESDVMQTFGQKGQPGPAPVYFSSLTLEDYAESYAWLNYFLQHQRYTDILSREKIIERFSSRRQQTKIHADGVAEDGSLRTSRVLNAGLTFSGELTIEHVTHHDRLLTILLLACANLRSIGTKRNRGFGDVRFSLQRDDGTELSLHERWKELISCTT